MPTPPKSRPAAQDHKAKAGSDAGIIDFDATRAERRSKEAPKRVRLGGKVFDLPARPPLAVMSHLATLMSIDDLEPAAQGAALNAAFVGIMAAIFGEHAGDPEVLAMTDEDLADFLVSVYEVEVPK